MSIIRYNTIKMKSLSAISLIWRNITCIFIQDMKYKPVKEVAVCHIIIILEKYFILCYKYLEVKL